LSTLNAIFDVKQVNNQVMNNRFFAIGDIHGCFDSFKDLIENEIKLQKNDTLVLLGDYIDRGLKSKEVIDYIINLQEQSYTVFPLIGNHEVMMLDSLKNEKTKELWIQNGGKETLKSFNINSISELSNKYLDFFENLPYYYMHENYLFVHAGFNDNIINPFEDKYSMVWHSRQSYLNPLFAKKIIIHGHRPVTTNFCNQQLKERKQVINIDTGCVYNDKKGYGKLTAIEIYSGIIVSK